MIGEFKRSYSNFDLNGYYMTNQNLKRLNSNRARPYAYSKPITYSNLCPHRHHKRNTVPRICDKINQQKGIIFIWPQRRKFYYQKEVTVLAKLIAHSLYWLHILNLLPGGAGGGAGVVLRQPPWHYKPPLPKPENRDYIIEPDWHSQYL